MPGLKEQKASQEGRFFAIISYISFLCIITLILKKDNKFALFHAKQGLTLFVLETASFLLSIIPVFTPFLKTFGTVIFSIVSVWAILQAFMGRYNRLPVISGIADNIIM